MFTKRISVEGHIHRHRPFFFSNHIARLIDIRRFVCNIEGRLTRHTMYGTFRNPFDCYHQQQPCNPAQCAPLFGVEISIIYLIDELDFGSILTVNSIGWR